MGDNNPNYRCCLTHDLDACDFVCLRRRAHVTCCGSSCCFLNLQEEWRDVFAAFVRTGVCMTVIMLLTLNDAAYLRSDVGAVTMMQRHVVKGLIHIPTFFMRG